MSKAFKLIIINRHTGEKKIHNANYYSRKHAPLAEYKYLGAVLDNKLKFKNTNLTHRNNERTKRILPSKAIISEFQWCCFIHFLPKLYCIE